MRIKYTGIGMKCNNIRMKSMYNDKKTGKKTQYKNKSTAVQ